MKFEDDLNQYIEDGESDHDPEKRVARRQHAAVQQVNAQENCDNYK